MPSQRRKNLWHSLPRRFTAGLLLAIWLTTGAGSLPLPAPFSKMKDGQPFPCQDHPCGCATAEDCWRHCCCFTAEERWAWARQHNIEPPAYAERPAEGSPLTAQMHEPVHEGCIQCQTSISL